MYTYMSEKGQEWWLMPIILASQEQRWGGSKFQVPGQPWLKVSEAAS
jgi:hypothetical protein